MPTLSQQEKSVVLADATQVKGPVAPFVVSACAPAAHWCNGASAAPGCVCANAALMCTGACGASSYVYVRLRRLSVSAPAAPDA